MVEPPEWPAALEPLRGGTLVVVGRPGRGKSVLVRHLVERLAARHPRVALLSADMGQASVGAPACLSVALEPPWTQAAASWFIGDVTPVGHLLPAVVGTVRLAQAARDAGAGAVVVDTTGLVDAGIGRALKLHKVQACRADAVVALQQGAELEPLLTLLEAPSRTVCRLQPASAARDRSAVERRVYREARFEAAFRDAARLELASSLLLGPDWAPARGFFEPGSLLGLLDAEGFCLDLGLLEELRPTRMLVWTPWRDAAAVARVQIGRLRMDRQGRAT